MDTRIPTTEEPVIARQHPTVQPQQDGDQRKVVIGIAVVGVIILIALVAGIIFLAQPTTDTARVRDIFIIFMALESILIGLALVILIVQIARLINLLQNEIKPILDSTNETVSNLRGTTTFLSENLIEPVISLNAAVAGLMQALKLIGLARKGPKERKSREGV
jgi:K+ transporter